MKSTPILFYIFLAFISDINAQCGFTGNEIIPDANTTQVSLDVNGAFNNDLASATQGVCAVRISFLHPHIGDLSIRLHSPSGQVITLIGNIGNSANTSNSVWDVTFIPTGSPPMPDIGILPQWSNTSNWQANSTYTGTYFPVTGNNLGQFNSGAVNGLWTIELIDGLSLDIGELLRFSIEFCDPSGISCTSCFKKAGVLPAQVITACAGSVELNTNITPSFPYGNNGANTSYKYIVSIPGDQIIALLDVIDMRSFPEGNYTVCGFAYEASNANLLPATDSTESFTAWKNQYFNGTPELCGDLTNECIVFHILEKSPLQEFTQYICGAGPITIQGQSITAPGNYNYTFTNRFGCDSSLTYEVLLINFNPILTVSNVLSCNKSKAIIHSNSNDFPVDSYYSWFNGNGTLSSGINLDTLEVSAPGTYFLALEKDGCTDTVSVQVTSDITLPQITLTSTHLNCLMPVRTISVVSNPSNVIILWSGPNGFSSTQTNPTVTVPGIYTVKVTKPDGCSMMGQVKVTGDFQIPQFIFIDPLKQCSNEVVTIAIQSTADISTYVWRLSNGQSFTTPSVTTPLNGWTYLTVTATNGCKYTDSIDIKFLFQNPVLNVRDTFINCSHPQVNLPVTTPEFSFSILWTGSNGFTSDQLAPLVTEAGIYQATAIEPNGCQTLISVIVSEDFVPPTLSITPASFGCKQDNLNINTTPLPINVQFSWLGPKNYVSGVEDPLVFETGWYFVTITASNGCTKIDSIFVGLNPANPDIIVDDDTLTCLKDTAQLFVNVINPAGAQVVWTGPNGFNSTLLDPYVDVPGKYWVKVTNPISGCFTNKSVLIVDLTSSPDVILYQDSINCIRDQARFGFMQNILIDDYYWITPTDDTIRNTNELFSTTVDTFDLVIYNIFGCRLDTFIHTAIDSSKPVITLNDHFITCSTPIVTLNVSSSFAIVNIIWTFPDGTLHTDINPNTSQYGIYKVKINGVNGCADSAQMQVLPDTMEPDVEVLGGTFTCKDKFFILDYSTSDTNGTIFWTGPENFSSIEPNPQVSISGMYYLRITGSNGCTGLDSSFVSLSDVAPSLELADDTINCRKNPLILRPVSNAVSPIYIWKSPDGSLSGYDSLIVTQPGIYTLAIIDAFECISYDTATVGIDTIKPLTLISNNYFLTCTNDSLTLKASDSVNLYTFEWLNSMDVVIGRDSLQLLTDAGIYSLKIKGNNGCEGVFPFIVTTDYIKPDLIAKGGELNCDFTKIELDAASYTANVQYEWDINNMQIFNRTHIVDQVGFYSVTVTAPNGCFSDTVVEVTSNFLIPDLMTVDGSLSCDSSNYLLQAQTLSTGSSYGWFGPNSFFSEMQNVYIDEIGTYYIFLKGINGCLNIDTIEVDNNPLHPVFSLNTDSITCYTPQVPINVIHTDTLERYTWIGPGGFTSTTDSLIVYSGGTYFLTGYGENGCPTLDSIFVPMDVMIPDASFSSMDSILCEHRVIELNANIPPLGDNYSYLWSSLVGNILSDASDTSILIRDPGIYSITTQNLRNGCVFTFTDLVKEKPNRISEIIVDIMNTSCKELSNGTIQIISVPNAIGSLEYSIIEGYYTEYDYFNRLAKGEYTIGVKDEYGCTFEQQFTMGVEDPIAVDLGPDTVITLGQNIIIDPDFAVDTSDILKIIWENAPDGCNQCLLFEDQPLKTIIYKIIIYTEEGCVDEDEKKVVVQSMDHIFIPNVFSPNGDGKNDRVQISVSTAVKVIKSFRIYDRWGNQVYGVNNFDPEDSNIGWDGSMKGDPLNPAVFVYYIEYELLTGLPLVQKGSITLVR